QGQVRQTAWTLWAPLGETHVGNPYEGELDAYLASHDIPFEVRSGSEAICSDPRHQYDAIERWFYNTWTRLDQKVKASIVEGVVVFLSLFDENPAVHRAFCPSRQAYITPPKPGEPRPLPPLEDLLETGHVLGLNFPVAMNPALARAGRHVEAGFPACGLAAHPQDCGGSAAPVAHPFRRRRVPRV